MYLAAQLKVLKSLISVVDEERDLLTLIKAKAEQRVNS